MCCNLFLVTSEIGDRRPLIVCRNGDTLCADCFADCRKTRSSKCPTCSGDLLPSPTENRALVELMRSYAGNALEIPVTDMEVDKKSVVRDGSSRIYSASWRRRNVVVKIVKSDGSEKQKKESNYEANLLIGLLHPNVIRLFGTTCMNGHFGIVMEQAAHGSLEKWIGKVDQESTARIAMGIVGGLEYLHSRKVVHRDIRPMTILMFGPKEDLIPKIGDFSTSKVIQSVTAHTQCGDDFYNAPEMRLCMRYGFAVDIFSLAITLFELFNRQMFRDAPREVRRVIYDVRAGKVGRIPGNSHVPACMRAVVERGWDQNPDVRPKLAEYRSVLRSLAKKPPVQPRPIREKRVSRIIQAEEMANVNVAIPAQAMTWNDSCDVLNSKQLRLKMVEDIQTRSTMASLVNESVLSAMRVVPRHLFVEERRMAKSSKQEMLRAVYTFNESVPATMSSQETSPEIIGAKLSMTEIIQGQSVLLVGINGGYLQAVIAQLVGINGSVESVTANHVALSICSDRISSHCPLSGNVEWIKVSTIDDIEGISSELRRRDKLFHTVIFCRAVERFPSELNGLLHEGGNVSILALVKGSGGTSIQLYLRRGNDAELRTITDFDGLSLEAY